MATQRMMPTRSLLLALLVLAVLPLAGSAQASDAPRETFAQQTLKPGDVIRLAIWREPDFSGEFTVDEAGVVTLPRLGQIQVMNFSSAQLQAELSAQYREFLRNPSIVITVLKRIQILGAVRNPSLYNVDATISITDALAMAGGVMPDGSQDKIEVRRDGVTLVAEVRGDVALANTPLRSGDQLYVPQRSWISRNSNIVIGAVGAVATLIIALSR